MCSPNFLFFLLIFIFAPFHYLSHCSGELCQETEKQALLSFKLSVNDTQGLISSWKPQVDCCMWEHIVCSNLTGHVLELHLQNPSAWPSPGLKGRLDDSLLNLTHLRYLNLSWNDFEGPVPTTFLGSFPNLEYLDLRGCRLNGTLEDSLLNLTQLRYLDLGGNYFEGRIPTFFGSFPNLEYLDLFYAGFTGTIPHTIGNLSSLRTLILGDEDGLDADSLEWVSGLSHLEHLDLTMVNLSKAVDWLPVVNTLPSLAELRLFGGLWGSIPYSFLPLTEVNFSSLNTLDLSYNHFEIFPSWILQIKELTHLELYGIRYSSIIPSSTSNLTKLQYLYISSDNFTSIPDWIFGCTSLESFSMRGSSLQGSIPRAIGNLTSLNFLDLSYSELSGEIPSEIAKLCNIHSIDLSYNKLQGEISHPFRNMSSCFLESLEVLDLGGNQFGGHLTDEFLEFRNLRILRLGKNSVSGSIPSSLRKLFALEELRLEGNNLSGKIPENIGQLYNLRYLSLSDNKLEGVVGENHFSNLTNLQSFLASRNNLTLEVGTNWIPTFRVSELELQSWNLGAQGKLPTWLHAQRYHLDQLDLSNTGIAFQFANWFWEIRSVNLSHNQLHGGIPASKRHFEDGRNDRSLYLGNNLFNGSLPRIAREVVALDLSNNLFSRGLHHFLCDESNDKYHLQILHLGKNLLSGEIPDCWMRWTDLKLLNLGNNNLSGHIPDSIGLIHDLLSLDLYNNKLSGRIPSSLQNCGVLNKIDLAYNQLSGNLPTQLGLHLHNLGILILRSNKLSGQISPDICGFISLQILDFSGNMFSGIIPSCIDNFIPMSSNQWFLDDPGRKNKYIYWSDLGSYIETADVATKGSKFQYDTILTYVTNFDLSNNNLSGEIPEQLTRLVELRSLNLSGNHLAGIIPHGIGDMKELESLDLSRNSLSGEIPDTLAVLTALNHVNLSYNNLTGRIPQSTQIMGLPPSGFVGNKLCDFPLPNNCNNDDETTPGQGDEEDDGDSKSEDKWLYIFSGLGYAVGLAAVFNVFTFKKSWKAAFFKSADNAWNKLYVYASIKISRRR